MTSGYNCPGYASTEFFKPSYPAGSKQTQGNYQNTAYFKLVPVCILITQKFCLPPFADGVSYLKY